MIVSVLSGVAVFSLTYGSMNRYVVVCMSLLVAALMFLLRKKGQGHTATIAIDYHAQHSKLNKVNPQSKILFSLSMLLLVVACPFDLVGVFVFLMMAFITLFLGKTKISYYVLSLFLPGMFIVLSGLSLAFDWSAVPSNYFDIPLAGGFLSITREGQAHARSVILKALAAISCLYMLSLSTPMAELIDSLRKAKVPSVLIELFYLIYRYIFIVMQMLHSMNTASKSRLGNATYRAKYASFLGIGPALLLRSLKRARLSFDAMESRCYDGQISFLTEERPVKPVQVLGMMSVFLAAVALWVFEGIRGLVCLF